MSAAEGPVVGILVGSESDCERMQPALDELTHAGFHTSSRFVPLTGNRTPWPSMRAARASEGSEC